MSTAAQQRASRRAAARARASRSDSADERAERYGQLLVGGYSPAQACWELRVSRRTGHRYADRLDAIRERAS